MKKIRDMLPAIFRSQAVEKIEDQLAETLPSIPVYGFENAEQAARFHNVLALQVPTEDLAAMAFDDYYPAFYFALKRFEQAKNSGASKENEARVSIGNFNNLPVLTEQHSVIERFYDLQKELHASITVDADGKCTDLNTERYMQAIFENLDILTAMKNAMHAPIKDIPQIRDTALADQAKPLKADLVTDRYGRAYSEEYLEEFFTLVTWAQENAPDYEARKISADTRPILEAPQQ